MSCATFPQAKGGKSALRIVPTIAASLKTDPTATRSRLVREQTVHLVLSDLPIRHLPHKRQPFRI